MGSSLAGKVALVTGAGRGIGQAMARALAGEGCAVAVQDIEVAVAQEACDEIRKGGVRAEAFGGDVREERLAGDLAQGVAEQLGPIDILINNAAIQSVRSWRENSAAECLDQWKANLLTPLLLSQQVVGGMIERGWGRIIHVGSIQQLRGNPEMMPYAMSKAALENMTRGMARDLAKEGITVNLIAPGYFDTWRNRDNWHSEEEKRRQAEKWVPMGYIGEPREVDAVVLMLCSEGGRYITGQSIFVDGGMSIRG